ncbi:hypothetical protein AK812_SmicGene12483 [Symbiodinium microadriaticum]|uniref:Uncharacterized protein n=1 Tax=Symbiodinium microadriaticum TaxID=2951 RepID=A0A1Q9EAK3_SYMMI|nr:hypothetical protein AK812_SmicGene12483 [Symbiodinium microadriaticum]
MILLMLLHPVLLLQLLLLILLCHLLLLFLLFLLNILPLLLPLLLLLLLLLFLDPSDVVLWMNALMVFFAASARARSQYCSDEFEEAWNFLVEHLVQKVLAELGFGPLDIIFAIGMSATRLK